MHINLTFFVQIINFLVLYWFLNEFMFKPVILFLQQKKTRDKKSKKSIEKKEQLLLGLEKKKDKELFDFQKKMEEQYKVVLPKLPEILQTRSFKVNKAEAKKLISVAKKVLMKRVPDVD